MASSPFVLFDSEAWAVVEGASWVAGPVVEAEGSAVELAVASDFSGLSVEEEEEASFFSPEFSPASALKTDECSTGVSPSLGFSFESADSCLFSLSSISFFHTCSSSVVSFLKVSRSSFFFFFFFFSFYFSFIAFAFSPLSSAASLSASNVPLALAMS